MRQTAFLIDAEFFGSPAAFTKFAAALDAAADWPKSRRRIAVFTLGWATDADEAQWLSMGWYMIQAMPRPASLSDLAAVRRLARAGPLEIFPRSIFHPHR